MFSEYNERLFSVVKEFCYGNNANVNRLRKAERYYFYLFMFFFFDGLQDIRLYPRAQITFGRYYNCWFYLYFYVYKYIRKNLVIFPFVYFS